jgi:hypothetical protein
LRNTAGGGGFDGSAAAKFNALIAATALATDASVARMTWAGSSVAGERHRSVVSTLRSGSEGLALLRLAGCSAFLVSNSFT